MRAFLIVKRFAIKNILYIFCAIGIALAIIYLENKIPDYKVGLFRVSRVALNCLFPSLITKIFGVIIDAIATTSLFVYFVGIGIKGYQEMGTTSEPKIMYQFPFIFSTLLIVIIAQSLLFGKFVVSCN